MSKLTLDFETRSEASLPDVGAWRYSCHPSTEVMCLGWSLDGLVDGQWRMGDPPPIDLFADVNRAEYVEAHNSAFELYVWENVCHQRYGWPAMPFDRWRCSASKAAASSIPRGLSDAGLAMHLSVVKDVYEGKSALAKLTKPKKDGTWCQDEDTWQAMLQYNRTDVLAEEALSDSLPDLSPAELEVWRCSERMNLRGMGIDVEGCQAAVRLAQEYSARLTAVFSAATGLQTAGQRAKFKVWLAQRGIEIADTTAGTLDGLLRRGGLPGDVEQAVSTVRALGRSSIKKYRTMLDFAGDDGRARGCFLWHGAGTGRWAGRGPQPQNYPRMCPADMDRAWEDIKTLDLETIELIHGDPMRFLSSCLRGAIVAAPGTRLLAGDYAQIEVRKLFWLAGEEAGLEIFRRGEDIYLAMASLIYNRPITKKDQLERFLGKQAELALGFGAGFVKFLVHCRALGAPPFSREQVCALVPPGIRTELLQWIMNHGWEMVKRYIENPTRQDAEELVLTKHVVNRYRAVRHKVTEFWAALEKAVRAAISFPGTVTHAGRIAYQVKGGFLNCRLPSGRIMRYCEPAIHGKDIVYMSVDDKGRWVYTKTYGGKLAENVTQASARDVMADAMLRLEGTRYKNITMTVHDELVVECAGGSLEEFVEIMAHVPDWAEGLPVKVEGFEAGRYRK